MKIRYDRESDSIELILKDKSGEIRKTDSPHVMQKVDSDNNVIAFTILKVSSLKKQGQDIDLVDVPQSSWTDFKLWYEIKS